MANSHTVTEHSMLEEWDYDELADDPYEAFFQLETKLRTTLDETLDRSDQAYN